MGLTENDSLLIKMSSQGLATTLIAPKDQEFNNGTLRLMIEDGEISTISCGGEIRSAAIRLEEITKKLRDDEWEIREAFLTYNS